MAAAVGTFIVAALAQSARPAPSTRAAASTRPATNPTTAPVGKSTEILEPIVEGTTQPAPPSNIQVHEGTTIVGKIGRLRYTAAHEAEFVYESDGRVIRLLILPSTELAQMEATVAASGADTRFEVTGMATEYRGRNYILIENVLRVARR